MGQRSFLGLIVGYKPVKTAVGTKLATSEEHQAAGLLQKQVKAQGKLRSPESRHQKEGFFYF